MPVQAQDGERGDEDKAMMIEAGTAQSFLEHQKRCLRPTVASI